MRSSTARGSESFGAVVAGLRVARAAEELKEAIDLRLVADGDPQQLRCPEAGQRACRHTVRQ
jgi:hypothetical protein